MHQLVQSALEAAKQGQRSRAMSLLKQAIVSNPRDSEALLVLADLVDDTELKREVWNRVLKVDPVNTTARAGLLIMDRQAMETSTPAAVRAEEPTLPIASDSPAPVRWQAQTAGQLGTDTQPVPVKNAFTNWIDGTPTAPPEVVPARVMPVLEKPLVFKYPLLWRIVMVAFVAFFGCTGLLVASQNLVNSLPFLVLAALTGLVVMTFSPRVEVSETGLRAASLFSSEEILWDEIATLKAVPMKSRLELARQDGSVVRLSTQVSGYPRIVELLRQRRPDLFGGPPPAALGGSYSRPRGSAATPAFSGTRSLNKSALKQYAILFIVVPFFFFALWTAMVEPANRVGASLAAFFCGALMLLPFFQVSSLRLEPDKLTIESTFEVKVVQAREVKEIKLQTVRGRGGRATNYVSLILATGKNYALQGFAEGEEILYGLLLNWWETYREE